MPQYFVYAWVYVSCLISHPNTTPLLFILFSFAVWLFDTVSDMAIIDKFWNFRLPILYPKNDSEMREITYLSYQTLTIGNYCIINVNNPFRGVFRSLSKGNLIFFFLSRRDGAHHSLVPKTPSKTDSRGGGAEPP